MKSPNMKTYIIKTLKSFVSDESGITAVEYGLLAGLVSTAIIGSPTLLGDGVSETFEKSADHIAGDASAGGQAEPISGTPFNAPPARSLAHPPPPMYTVE